MNPLSVILLVVGYPLAIAGIIRLRRTFRERNAAWFLVEVIGTAAIVAGWIVHGRRTGVIINSAWLLGLVAAWWWTGRRRPGQATPG